MLICSELKKFPAPFSGAFTRERCFFLIFIDSTEVIIISDDEDETITAQDHDAAFEHSKSKGIFQS